MQILHNTFIFYVQAPVAYISSFILAFFNILYVMRFSSVSCFLFQVISGDFFITERQHGSQSASSRSNRNQI